MDWTKIKYCVGGPFKDYFREFVGFFKEPNIWEEFFKPAIIAITGIVYVFALVPVATWIAGEGVLWVLTWFALMAISAVLLFIGFDIKERCDKYETTNNERSAS